MYKLIKVILLHPQMQQMLLEKLHLLF